MSDLPLSRQELLEQFGPTLRYRPPGGFDQQDDYEKLVPTHCCFCGQQCGIHLKVKDNAVVGFEPRTDFPFNKGKLCPKGVKRYLQGSHPDRLLHPMKRTEKGFVRISWDQALEETVSKIREIQDRYGRDSFAMLSGVSLNNEKSYLVGKFARLALQTANLDYNGRLCMVSAGAANKKAYGIDRASSSWEDIAKAKVIFVIGTNIAECFPITTDYIWRARDNGAKLIYADPRMVPMARTADLYLPLRPGSDSALLMAMLHVIIRDGLTDQKFISEHTVDFEKAAAEVKDATPEWAAKITGVPAEQIEKAARWYGEAETGMILHARGLEHQVNGVKNVLCCANLALATGKIGREGCGHSTITGQGNGQGGREHGHKCDQLPGARDIENPEHRAYIAKVWGCDESEIPRKGLSAQEIMNEIHAGNIKGLLSICFNPLVSLPDANFTREALGKLEHYTVIDFFLSETAQHADIVLPGSLHEEDEGTNTSCEGRVIKINQAIDPPGEAWQDWRILLDIAERLGRGKYFRYQNAQEIFNELRLASRGGTADYSGITWERVERENGVFWPCPQVSEKGKETLDASELDSLHPGIPRLFEGGQFYHMDKKARFTPTQWSESAEVVDSEYPVWLTTGRVISQYLSGTQTRRIGPLVDQYPHPRIEMHTRMARQLGIAEKEWVTLETRRGKITLRSMVVNTIRPDTVFVPYHWAGKQSINMLTQRALDPTSKIPEFKVSACKVRKATEDEIREAVEAESWTSHIERLPERYGLDDRRSELTR
ncbi:molybdopterin oxidoreductase family protein [Deinococcus cellulosilyticus]|uniref:Assimilatory nitrate reductase catalytic subunit n=1 Tax=Deinococcus cellulosilyticus (strain DSM 18568 / NBRC 106333 / KACC 11606 / 5516J-15) TaxID=1223518 RepID=A0A511N088_DEIC1|nr:molybdopterin oxidoreductase family protein [Deinococcus cellulosilyticus]GEM46290.1 assimilatory nitrate reductase catalytic subunit [Deinococcus cellulosilyticus NBRC 106333 = KACC 11606]